MLAITFVVMGIVTKWISRFKSFYLNRIPLHPSRDSFEKTNYDITVQNLHKFEERLNIGLIPPPKLYEDTKKESNGDNIGFMKRSY